MIEFATLLIGLVAGERSIELVVQEPIAFVEIVLDGQRIAEIGSAPWQTEIDLGDELEPHRLVANGLDKNGLLVDSTHQLLNYNRPSFEATILLEPSQTLIARKGRVVWKGALEDPPIAIHLRFDDRQLEVDSRGRFSLPIYDPDEIHLLEALVRFDHQHSADAVLTFGGVYGDQLTSALTAIPLISATDQPWSLPQVQDWIVTRGRRPDIFKVTAGPGLLVVLRGDQFEAAIRGARTSGYQKHPKAPPHRLGYDVSAISTRSLKGHDGTFRVTDVGKAIPQQGLRPLILRRRPLVPNRGADGRTLQRKGQKLWDALAVATTRASSSGRPRAVLLMLDSDKRDKSDLDPVQAIRYLQSVHVPLFVWGRDQDAFESIRAVGLEKIYVGGSEIDRLCLDIAEELASQTIVWLQGEYLPIEVALVDGVPPGVDFVH